MSTTTTIGVSSSKTAMQPLALSVLETISRHIQRAIMYSKWLSRRQLTKPGRRALRALDSLHYVSLARAAGVAWLIGVRK